MEILVSIVDKEDRSLREVRCALNGRIVVGRGPETAVPVDGPAISREHLFIEPDGEGVFLTDVSANGCWINGARVPKSRRMPVRESDVVEVPGFEIRIRGAEAAPEPAAIAAPTPEAVAKPAPAGVLGPLAAVRGMAGAFTRDEKFTAAASLVSLGLIALYILS